MTKKSSGHSYLSKFAKILMDEGDLETANALISLAESSQSREMTEEELEDYSLHKSNTRKALSYNDYERAVDFQGNAVQIVQQVYGIENLQTLEDVTLLGDCLHKNGDFDEALEQFYLVRKIAIYKFGIAHSFTKKVTKKIRDCEVSITRTQGFDHLADHLDAFFTKNSQDTPAAKLHRLERLDAIGQKLVAKKQMERATTIYQTWIKECVEDAPPNDENAIQCIFKYADFHMQSGNLSRASEIFRDLVGLRNRQNHMGAMQLELKIALEKWAHCLVLRGQTKSAGELIKLAEATKNLVSSF